MSTAIPRPVTPDEARDQRPLLHRLGPSLLLGGVATVATLALHVHDPHHDGSWGKCPSLLMFGVYCPVCGGLRGVNDLTRLDLPAAWSSNALTFIVLPLLVFWWLRVIRDRWRGSRRPWLSYLPGSRWSTAILTAVLLFTVVRNLPFGAGLAP